jgi:hypothetical protein
MVPSHFGANLLTAVGESRTINRTEGAVTMKRLLAVLVGAGIAVGGGAAAWAAPSGPNKEAAKACLADARAANPGADKATLRAAVKSCLADQGITLGAARDALKACVQGVKAANPNATRAQLRDLAKPCLEQAGITPGTGHPKLAAARECLAKVRADHPGATRQELRPLVKACVQGG